MLLHDPGSRIDTACYAVAARAPVVGNGEFETDRPAAASDRGIERGSVALARQFLYCRQVTISVCVVSRLAGRVAASFMCFSNISAMVGMQGNIRRRRLFPQKIHFFCCKE